MRLSRFLRHLFATRLEVRRAFSAADLTAIEEAIRETEATHAGQIRFAVEAALEIGPLWRNQTARERAVDVFSRLGVWDTEHNNGVLIYLLWADHAVEIVADRGIHARLGQQVWEGICRDMERSFLAGDFTRGVVDGIHAVGGHLSRHFPKEKAGNELPDQPVLL